MSYRKPYSKKEIKGYGRKDTEFKEEHESFGMLSIFRTQGSTRLFGSHLDSLGSFITLRINAGSVRHSLSRDWYSEEEQLIEIHMSAAQFAEAITTLNTSPSTPCTVVRVLGSRMEDVPEDRRSEKAAIEDGFREDVRGLVSKLVEGRDKALALLDKKTLTKTDKQELVEVFRVAIQDVKDNLPFVVKSFQESTQKTVTQAKAEVDAFVSMAVQLAGLEALQGRLLPSVEAPALTSGEDDR